MSTAFITGCSSGYGHAIAQRFLDQGWNVVATMRRPDATLFAPSDRLRLLALDVTDEEAVAGAVAQALRAFDGIDALVNNAGIGCLSAFEATPSSVTRELFETNTFGLMAVTRAVIPHLRQRGRGVVVNVSSSVCFAGMPLVASYAASKWAVEGFTEALFYELDSFGVRVKLVEPGYGPGTRFTANGGARMAGLVPPPYQPCAARLMQAFAEPGPVTTAGQVAAAVWAAATDRSDRLRFPAGPDSEQLAQARWAAGDEPFLQGLRARLRMPRPAAA